MSAGYLIADRFVSMGSATWTLRDWLGAESEGLFHPAEANNMIATPKPYGEAVRRLLSAETGSKDSGMRRATTDLRLKGKIAFRVLKKRKPGSESVGVQDRITITVIDTVDDRCSNTGG